MTEAPPTTREPSHVASAPAADYANAPGAATTAAPGLAHDHAPGDHHVHHAGASRSVLAMPAWLRVAAVLPIIVALWLAVWWANEGAVWW